MTGTAETELTEFNNIYDLSVAVVPTNREVSATTPETSSSAPRAASGTRCTEIARMHKRAGLRGYHLGGEVEQIGELLDEDDVVRAPQRKAGERRARG